jgi:hypothetical protein
LVLQVGLGEVVIEGLGGSSRGCWNWSTFRG